MKKQTTTKKSVRRSSVSKRASVATKRPARRAATKRSVARTRKPLHHRVKQSFIKAHKKLVEVVSIETFLVIGIVGLVSSTGLYIVRGATGATYKNVGDCAVSDKDCLYYTRQGQMTLMYMGMLNRQPDKTGLEYWLTQAGGDAELAAKKMLDFNSTETNAARNMTASQYVDALYARLFGRAADSGGKTYWVNRLGDNSTQNKAEVTRAFADSTESMTRNKDTVINKLREFYPAPATSTGGATSSGGTSTSTGGTSSSGTSSGGSSSSGSTSTTPSSTPSTTSTSSIYGDVVNSHSATSCQNNYDCYYISREGKLLRAYYGLQGTYDQAGFNYWIKRFPTDFQDNQNKLGDAMISVIPAAKDATADQYITLLYKNLLGRDPDPTGLNYWKGVLAQQGKSQTLFTFSNFNDVRNTPNFKGSGKTLRDKVGSDIDKMYANTKLGQELATAQSQATVQRYNLNNDANNPQANTVTTYAASGCQNNIECMYNSREGKIVRIYMATTGAPDTDGFKYWVQQLASSQYSENYNYMFEQYKSVDSTIKGMNNTQLATQFYLKTLERGPDTAGLLYWVGQLDAAGTTGRGQVLLNFTSMDDVALRTNYKNTGLSFREAVADQVNKMYATLGSQIPQTATHTNATNPQQGNTLPYSAVTCNANAECMYNSREGQVTRLYMYMTNRAPSSADIATWTNYYTDPYTGTNSSTKTGDAILGSNEQRLKDLRGVSNENYIKDLYAFVLGRTAETADVNIWLPMVQSSGRTVTALALTNMPEAKISRNVPVLANTGKNYMDRVVDLVHTAFAEKGSQIRTTYTPPPPPVTSTRQGGSVLSNGTLIGDIPCAAPNVVDGNGKCVAPPPNERTGYCVYWYTNPATTNNAVYASYHSTSMNNYTSAACKAYPHHPYLGNTNYLSGTRVADWGKQFMSCKSSSYVRAAGSDPLRGCVSAGDNTTHSCTVDYSIASSSYRQVETSYGLTKSQCLLKRPSKTAKAGTTVIIKWNAAEISRYTVPTSVTCSAGHPC